MLRVRINNSAGFKIRSGLKQGDALSTILFNIVLENAKRSTEIKTELLVGLLAYANDIDFIEDSTPTAKGIFNHIDKATREVGLNINEEKTKMLCLNRQGFAQKHLKHLKAESLHKVAYGCEAWTMTKADEEKLKRVKRKILRNIFGTDHDPKNIRTKAEISQLSKKFIISQEKIEADLTKMNTHLDTNLLEDRDAWGA
ncbi:uncharacterized protein LOC125503799 [Dendroctonus ponderosae]|uniref:uncharacterized protein LOC125503799 n=1 Tax=Dendroctonus ponderosae TaxID=77166 RepID=UPI002034D97E|nr:uncharacterized protein LOC125503799 [Dendroctonus ponderosae]